MEFETQPRTECNDEGATSAVGLWKLNQRRRTGQRRQGGWVRGGDKAHLGNGGNKEARLGI